MIGFSKFCELQPKFVVPVTASGMQNVCVCVCQIHQNTKLLTAAIPGGNHGDYKKILEKMVCSVENRYAPSFVNFIQVEEPFKTTRQTCSLHWTSVLKIVLSVNSGFIQIEQLVDLSPQ